MVDVTEIHGSPLELIESALAGTRGDDQQRIAEVGLDWLETLLKKNIDYGSSAWREPILSPAMNSAEAIFVRMSDKIERIRSLRSNPALVNESIEDTVKDLGAYCLLWLSRPNRFPEKGK